MSATAGITCDRCGCAELNEHDRELDCAQCGNPRVWLESPAIGRFEQATRRHELPDPCGWLGLVRLADNRWRCVASSDTEQGVWDCLQTFPLDGDRLVWPVMRR